MNNRYSNEYNIEYNEKHFVEIYIKKLKLESKIIEYDEILNKYKIDINEFEKFIKKELTEDEWEVFESFVQGNTLKKTASKLNYSYSFVRKIYIDLSKKLKFIANLHNKYDI